MGRAATREQVERLIRRLERREPPRRPVERPPSPPLHELLAGIERRETAAGACSFREVRYAADHRVGTQPLAGLAAVEGQTLALLAPNEAVETSDVRELLFLDIETTGLGGAGAMAFLVATGRFEGGCFVLRQYLALSPAEEGALLDALLADARIDDGPVLVTYNGHLFDAPMLDQRATMHRRRAGFDSLRHIDLLRPARTLYRGLLPSCRLSVVEAEVLALTRPGDEVPGGEVPAWYFRFLRSGDARCLLPLISHNALDVLALGGLLARLSALARAEKTPESGIDALALGRLFAERGRPERALACLAAAVRTLAPSLARDDALMRLAALHKRRGRRDLAEPLWRELAARPAAASLRARVELAMYYEHHRRDFALADGEVGAAMEIVDGTLARNGDPTAARWRESLAHRRARIRARAARAAAAS